MPFQIKQNTLNLSVPIERLAGAYYRIQRTKQNISLSCLAKELRMNKGFLSDLENGKRHFPDGLCKQIDSILNTNFNTNYDLYILSRKYLYKIFENFFFERQQSILDIYKIIQESENNIINSYAYFTFKIVQLFYYLRIEKNNSKIIEIEALLNQNLNCLQSDEISIYYSLLGIFYKRDVASNHIALDYFLKSNMMCNSSSIVYSMNIFQLISVYAELNQPTLAYEKCISSKALLKQHNNYSRIITVDMFECITLTDLGLYNESKEKLLKILSSANNDYLSYKTDQIYHNLAWNALLSKNYDECIKYTNLAIENKDPSCDLCYFIPYSYYKQNEYLKCLDYIESHLEYADDFYKPFLQAISARIQKQNVDFEKNIILYYQSLLQNNVYEDIPLIQNFILDYYTETNNKDMMIKILIDIKSFNDKDLTLKSSTLFTTSQS